MRGGLNDYREEVKVMRLWRLISRTTQRCEDEMHDTQLDAQRAWMKKRGHYKLCGALQCKDCGYTESPHGPGVIRIGHEFNPASCDCGLTELMEGKP